MEMRNVFINENQDRRHHRQLLASEMKTKTVVLLVLLLFIFLQAYGQQKSHGEGVIEISDSDRRGSNIGTTRFNPAVHAFEIWDGGWNSLEAKPDFFSESTGDSNGRISADRGDSVDFDSDCSYPGGVSQYDLKSDYIQISTVLKLLDQVEMKHCSSCFCTQDYR